MAKGGDDKAAARPSSINKNLLDSIVHTVNKPIVVPTKREKKKDSEELELAEDWMYTCSTKYARRAKK